MGLFWQTPAKVAPDPTERQRQVIRISETDRKNLSCAHCPLDMAQLIHPKMPPTGSDNPVLYFIGEANGKTEDETGVQFNGESGSLIRDRVPSKWAQRIRWNNTIRCRPPQNRDPAPIEVECCRRLQVEDIERTKPQAIVCFGRIALEWFLGPGDRAMADWRGRRMPVKVGGHTCWLYPITHPAALLRQRNEKKKGAAYVRTFERDLERVFANATAGFPAPYVEPASDYLKDVHCLTEYGAGGLSIIEDVLFGLYNDDHTIDLETDRLRPYHPEAKILSVAVGTFDATLAFPWQHSEARWTTTESALIKDMVFAYLMGKGRKWAHGAKFEMEWMAHLYGHKVVLDTLWGDTLGQAHILDERKGKALEARTLLYFGFDVKAVSNLDRKKMASYPLSKILPYNGMDTKYTDLLRYMQAVDLEAAGLTQVYEARNNDTPGLVLMQRKGVVRDPAAIKILHDDLFVQEEKIVERIMRQADVVTFMNAGNKFMPTSNPNLVTFFRDYLKIEKGEEHRNGGAWHKSGGAAKDKAGDKYSVDEGALAQIRHPVARLLLEMRTIQKNHGYINPLLPNSERTDPHKDAGKCIHGDGLIHGAFSNYITASGRLNSEDPNLQNFPRRKHKEIRRAIGCPPGCRFAAFDYGQLEWRIGAMLSRDRNMILELLQPNPDIHGHWTDTIGGEFIPHLVKADRKSVRDSMKQYWTFANLYGNTLDGIAWDLSKEFEVDISPLRLKPHFTSFWGRYPGLQQYQDHLMDIYWRFGYVETGTGQRRHEPLARNEIINHPFQGTAGHLVIDAQSRLSRAAVELDRPQLQPVLNVHDDLSFYLPWATIERDVETIARLMIQCPFDFIGNVPLTVEASMGYNWCDKSEIGTFHTRDFAV